MLNINQLNDSQDSVIKLGGLSVVFEKKSEYAASSFMSMKSDNRSVKAQDLDSWNSEQAGMQRIRPSDSKSEREIHRAPNPIESNVSVHSNDQCKSSVT